MSAKLRVEELRAELQRRGLDASGNKPALVSLTASVSISTPFCPDCIVADVGPDTWAFLSVWYCEWAPQVFVHMLPHEKLCCVPFVLCLIGVMLQRLFHQVRRLDAAISEEKVAATAAATAEVDGDGAVMDGKGNGGNERKRRRTGDGEEEGKGDASSEATKLEGMGYRELQGLAKARGLAANGGKKELLKRLLLAPVNAVAVVDGGVQDKKEASTGLVINFSFLLEMNSMRSAPSFRELAYLIGSDVDERVEEEVKKEKMVTATKKGAAVLDQHIPDHIKMIYHVLQVGDDIYDATLNQTNIGNNNNKFYIIQVLESDSGGSFMVYNRWGRVGARGQDKLHGPFTIRDQAIYEFEGKFQDKTNNLWSDRKKFECYAKKYTWLEMDYGETEDNETVSFTKHLVCDLVPALVLILYSYFYQNKAKNKGSITDQIKETKLETRIAQFVSLICNISMMKQQMVEIGYNADKLPLGKLSKSTILKGYDVLKRISNVISRADRRQLEQLTGEFYTVIPHDFGFRKMREFIIDTPQKLKAKLEMVEALGEIEIATKLLEVDSGDQDDPLYARYKQLRCNFVPLEVDSEEYSMVSVLISNLHKSVDIQCYKNLFDEYPWQNTLWLCCGHCAKYLRCQDKVKQRDFRRIFKQFANAGNRMLLWHGSRLSNWAGILSQGLRIAPPEAPVTGYMFGKGVYFADMFSKSANYCYASGASRSGVLLLCEVALGDMNELLNADYNANNLPKGKLSTKGVGQTAPDLVESKITEDGVVVPYGKPKEEPSKRGSLLYNEYIVYNVDQIRMRYVLHVNFNFKR
ncbi:hypothetical protein PR202_ga22913 [Eleusine coracana subsp. coracana]|uniref:Poly [ADP-ribose] polymerase n=1 Tax=Eleusine coracana subsp. coracana TaxID=191504 RepID=A0AAV5D4V1_ELECO|nr:hypothetical protein PR202_ga22913 [Eleusine coracana subsp. coracana]